MRRKTSSEDIYHLTLSILQTEPLSKLDSTQVLQQIELILKTCAM